MQVSVAYTEPSQQIWLSLDVPESSTVQQAIERSGILARCPGLDLKDNKVGIFGKITKLTAPLADGDRVEIYRPITVDPKTVPQRKIALLDEDEDEDDATDPVAAKLKKRSTVGYTHAIQRD